MQVIKIRFKCNDLPNKTANNMLWKDGKSFRVLLLKLLNKTHCNKLINKYFFFEVNPSTSTVSGTFLINLDHWASRIVGVSSHLDTAPEHSLPAASH